MEILLNISIFLVPSLFAGLTHIYWIRHGAISKYRKLLIFIMYLFFINICTFSISYVRGVKSFNFGQMTLSYRLKYIGMGCILGMALLAAVKVDCDKTKQSVMQLSNDARHSNFDLLKILSMGMIVLFHYAYGKWDYSSMGNYKVIMDIIWMFGELGVNVFALISGYFMIEQDRPFKTKKICLMWLQVLFYSILSIVIASKMGALEIDQGRVLQTIFPITYRVWWYATAYFGLYFLAPFMNKGLKALDKKEYRRLLTILLLVFSVWPTLIGIFHNDTEIFFDYNRFIWLMILYCIAGYIRIYGINKENWRLRHWGSIHFCTWFLILLFIVFMPENGVGEQILMKNTYFWHPNSILMVALAISLFMIFSKIQMRENRIICYIASCTFGIYLGHSERSKMIWNAIFHRDLVGTKAVLTDMLCAFTCIVMATLFIESIRKQIEKIMCFCTAKILNKMRIGV